MEAFNIINGNKLVLTDSNDPSFYTIDHKTKPIPYGTSVVNFSLNDDGTVKSANVLYDPYDVNSNDLQIITWLRPVPYSTPLYIYSSSLSDGTTTLSFSFTKNEKMTPYEKLREIYVLTDPKKNLPSVYKKNTIHDKFTFARDMGRCIPDPNSKMGLNDCLRNFKVEKDDVTVLGYVNKHKNPKTPIWLILFTLGVYVFTFRNYFTTR